MSYTSIVQRKRVIPHSMIKNNRYIIQCCNNTHQGRHLPANKRAFALQTSLMLGTLLVVGNDTSQCSIYQIVAFLWRTRLL